MARELIVLDVMDAALLALDRALLQSTAAARRALGAYRRTAERIMLRRSQRTDLPF
jgi:hypothetical protein